MSEKNINTQTEVLLHDEESYVITIASRYHGWKTAAPSFEGSATPSFKGSATPSFEKQGETLLRSKCFSQEEVASKVKSATHEELASRHPELGSGSAVQQIPSPIQRTSPSGNAAGAKITAPLPGIIIGISVKVGDSVKSGQEVAVLEAMKMENSIESTADGTVTAIHVNVSDSVLEGSPIISIN